MILLCYVAVRRLRRAKQTAVALVRSLVVATAFVGVYSQDLITIFP